MRRASGSGFTLLEVLVALGVLATGVLALSALVLSTGRAVAASQQLGVAQLAAREKLEELRGLAWTSDAAVVPISDWSTDLTVSPPVPAGGVGLGASPGDTLRANVTGYCDFLDHAGRWLAGGTSPPSSAAWVRRWMVRPLDPLIDVLALQVLVVPLARSSAATTETAAQNANGAWLMTLRVRRSR